jgi:hypothetical protein
MLDNKIFCKKRIQRVILCDFYRIIQFYMSYTKHVQVTQNIVGCLWEVDFGKDSTFYPFNATGL